MSFSIQTNVSSLIAQENMRVNSQFQSRTIERLTSGYRINASGDDAAGLAVANGFRSSIAELQQGVRNANDGLSALQIVDGGLNNIAKTLDRLKTLATQSASSTFNGDRSTLNDEYQGLLKEVDRQASNIGLVNGGRYNTQISVYIGGGSNAANAQVTIDLTGAANQVDSSGLSLSTTNILGGGTGLTGNSQRLDAPGATFLAASSQDFTFNLYSGGSARSVTVTVGGAGGGGTNMTGQQVIDRLNSQLNSYGINAQLGSNGALEFGGGTPFTVSTTGGAAANNPITTAGASVSASNNGVYSATTAATYTAAAENLTFQNGTGTANVSLLATETLDSAIAKINAQTSSLGIYAVANEAGTGIALQSGGNFTASTDAAGVFAATGAQTIAAPTATAQVTGAALSAVTAIDSAVASLGKVQGRVGSGQNRLQYSIQLAQSQIASFSAAESRIRDADVASEAANLTKAQVLQQASMAALAQANSAPQAVLSLLRG